MSVFKFLFGSAAIAFTHLFTGVRSRWAGSMPSERRRIYYANHASHGDFVLVWSVLPPRLRSITRPVASAEYWRRGWLRRFLSERVFRALLIDRDLGTGSANPVLQMCQALDEGDSLIFFPEGTRNVSPQPLLDFKSGLFHLARQRPEAELIPVWIDNLSRVMPKGSVLPVPLLCTVTFGAPITVLPDETKDLFLARARADLLALAPERGSAPERELA